MLPLAFNTVPAYTLYTAIIFHGRVYDFALMNTVDVVRHPFYRIAERLFGARRVIGRQAKRIRLGLAVSIDDNPRERSWPAYLTHYKSGIARERDAGGYGD